MNDSLKSPPKPQRYWFSTASSALISSTFSPSLLTGLRERRYSIQDVMAGSSQIQPRHSLVSQQGYQLPAGLRWLLTRLTMELFNQVSPWKSPERDVQATDESLWTSTVEVTSTKQWASLSKHSMLESQWIDNQREWFECQSSWD